MSLGDNIKNARIKMKLKQQELADLLSSEDEKYSNTAISNWENNVNKPDPDTIASLCKILKVDANYLLDFNVEEKADDLQNSLNQYRVLFNKDPRLTQEQKEFWLEMIETQYRKFDETHKEIKKD